MLVGTGAGLGALTVTSGRVIASAVGEYNVGIRTAAAERAAKNAADRVDRVLDWADGTKTITGSFAPQALEQLRSRRDVRYVERNGTLEAIAQTQPWGIDRVDAEVAHAAGETGGDDTDGDGGADVAIIDTGIDSDHPDLQPVLGSGEAFVDCRGRSCRVPWDDDEGHGTHCAGTAGAVDNSRGVVGVSTQATLHAVKVLDKRGSGSYSDVAAGIKYVADQGWDVGSLSLGGGKSSAVEDACEYAYDRGVLLVAAAGNSGPCTDCVGYPAAEPEVIAVTATNRSDGVTGFSSNGPETELAAPGANVYSTYVDGTYETLSGTSMACPHVSGAAAQLMDNGYTNTEARTRLRDTAEDLGLPDNEQGSGLVDVAAALGLDSSDSGSNSTDAAPTVTWATPTDGTTVAGTVTVQLDASDTEDADDSLSVSYTVDGGGTRATTYDSTSGYYEDSWDTTTVADGEHTLTATVTDSAGNTTSATVTVTTDNVEEAPTVDSLSLAEVETSDADAEFDADWAVSDADGNLSSVDLTLVQDNDGTTEDTATVSVGGDTASGTTRLVAAGDDGSANGYTVSVTVTDGSGATGSGTASVTETEASPPTVDSVTLTDDGNPQWERYYVDWTVSDTDGDLASVRTELIGTSSTVLATDSSSVGGNSASGTHYVESKTTAAELVVTVSDGAGNTDTATRSV